jgi:predicted house-cleaning noncanonical NTP pyrophosphatase (MazG superfamily)
MSQGKLVRDKIPQIIRSKGLEPVTYVASADEYGIRLPDKLREEVEEFIASDNDPEERGGFADRIIWLGNQPAANHGEGVSSPPAGS